MHYIPITTEILHPPQSNLYPILDTYLTDLREGDLVLITSKIVSIHQGRCVPIDQTTRKRNLVVAEAEHILDGQTQYQDSPLAIKYGALFFAAGIDESNANGHYILLPQEPYETARDIWTYLRAAHGLTELGVIITDSHNQPLRWGCTSISIGHWGFHPVNHHTGRTDLFGRPLHYSSTGVADTVAAGAAVVSGETDECTPIVIAREVPAVRFTEADTRSELMIAPEDDLFWPLLKVFYSSQDPAQK